MYNYEPLCQDEPHIRLLTILPRDEDGLINLSLEHVSLDDACYEYAAISYMWGPASNLREVKVNGLKCVVRENIWQFMNHCYNPGFKAPEKVWIDSICINQNDLDEKSSQIQMMGAIFKDAIEVIVWLGLEASGKNILYNEVVKWTLEKDPSDKLYVFEWTKFLKEKLPEDLQMTSQHPIQQCIQRIVSANYWKRLWIVQEVSLNHTAKIVSGNGFINVHDLKFGICNPTYEKRVFHGALEERVVDDDPEQKLTSIMAILDLKIEIGASKAHKSTKTLAGLMSEFYGHLCENPKDKIFGLFGLTRSADTFKVNYQDSAEVIFSQAIQCYWQDCIASEAEKSWKFSHNMHLKLLDVHRLMTALCVTSKGLQASHQCANTSNSGDLRYPFLFLTASAYLRCSDGTASKQKAGKFISPYHQITPSSPSH